MIFLPPAHARPPQGLKLQLWKTYTEKDKRPGICPEENDGAEGALETTSCKERLAELGMLTWRREIFRKCEDYLHISEGQLCEEGWNLYQWVELLATLVLMCSLGRYFLDTYSLQVLN